MQKHYHLVSRRIIIHTIKFLALLVIIYFLSFGSSYDKFPDSVVQNTNNNSHSHVKDDPYQCLIECNGLEKIEHLSSKFPWKKGDIESISTHFIETQNAIENLREKSDCDRNIMTYECSTGYCGGFGDRIRGSLHTFYWALATGYQFQVWWDNPIDVFEYFEPSSPLAVKDNVKNYKGNTSHTENIVMSFKPEQWSNSSYIKDQIKGYDLVRVRTHVFYWNEIMQNQLVDPNLIKIYPYLFDLSGVEKAHIVLKMMFSNPTRYLKNAYAENMSKYDSSWFKIGIQHRLGDLRFSSENPRNTLESADCFVLKALDVCKESQRSRCLFFLTADSPEAIERITKGLLNVTLNVEISIHVNEGDIIHIDMMSDRGLFLKKKVLKTYLDWYTMTTMDELVISRSGYGETAGWAAFKPTWRHSTSGECLFFDYFELISRTSDYGLTTV